jgi:hypothetical protein
LNSQALARAYEMIQRKIKKTMKDASAGKAWVFVDWCKKNQREALNEDETVIIPINRPVDVDLLGYFSIRSRDRVYLITNPYYIPTNTLFHRLTHLSKCQSI